MERLYSLILHTSALMSGDAVINVVSLGKTYRDGLLRRQRREVLRELTFAVQRGEVFGLLGPNGAGKTTFIKILLGIVRKTSGDATLLGHAAGDRRGRRLVGYLPEHLRISRHHNAHTALDYYGQLSGLNLRQIRERRDDLLKTVGLADRARDSVAKYSKGMLQRLGLAQALLHDPQVVMLDEPTDGLDPVGRSHVRSIMLRLKEQGKTVFVNSHILQEVELVCDRVAILDQGALRFVGPVKEITAASFRMAAPGTNENRSQELEVNLEIAGPEQGITAALQGKPVAAWERFPNDLHHVQTRVAMQSDVDALVDQLRRSGVSIISLSRRRVSLEDAFLALLAEPK